MKSIVTFILLFLMLSLASGQSRTLTLEETIRLALENNLDLRKAGEQLRRAEIAAKEARANRYATADLKASYNRFSEVMEMTIAGVAIPNMPISIPGRTIRFGDEDNYESSISLVQPIYAGQRLSSQTKAAEEDVLVQQMNVKANRVRIEFNAKKAFYELVKAFELKNIARVSYQQVAVHLHDLNHLYDQGLVAQNDVLTGEVKLADAEMLLINAENAIELANVALLNLLHLDLAQQVQPAYAAESGPQPVIDTLSAPVFTKKPEMQMLDFQLAALQYRHKAAKGASWPELAAFGSYVYGKPGLDKISNDWMSYWIAGLQINWNLWDWGKKSARAQQVESALRELSLGKSQLASALALDLKRTLIQIRAGQHRLQNSLKTLQSATENYRIVENGYREGVVSNSDYLDAQSDLTRAQIQKIQSQLDLQIAFADYERACVGAHE